MATVPIQLKALQMHVFPSIAIRKNICSPEFLSTEVRFSD